MADSAAQDKLRDQRDRFLAFAFAAADILLEVRANNAVSFCAGATDSLFGLPNDKVLGRSLFELVDPADAPLLQEALRRLLGTGRFDRLRLAFRTPDGRRTPLIMSGMVLASRRNIMHIALSLPSLSAAQAGSACPVGTDDFVAMLERRTRENHDCGDDFTLTLLDLSSDPTGGYAGAAARFLEGVEGYLRAWSVGGDSVGRLDDHKFGVLHDKSVSNGQLQRRINEMAPGGAVSVRAATIDMAPGCLGPHDVAKALVYTINSFLSDDNRGSSISSLPDGYQAAVEETLSKVADFRSSITGDSLALVFQPIVCLYSYTPHHYEVLARLSSGGRMMLPSAFVGFAERLGVVHELDLTVTRRAIGTLREEKVIPAGAKVAVNISGGSVSNTAFAGDLLRLLDEHADIAPRLLFELTETSDMKNLDQVNGLLQKLRRMGCGVCLDDFGAGAAAFQYLRALQVDYVKIDGSYILDAFDSRHGRPFLKAMAGLCRDLGIFTIGEMVENERSASLLRDLGLDYGQGYLFARPQADVSGLRIQIREGGEPPRRLRGA